MRSITSYHFRSIARNQCVMFPWYLRRLVSWLRVGLFAPTYLAVVALLCLLFVLEEFAWKVLLPREYRHKRDEFFPVDDHS